MKSAFLISLGEAFFEEVMESLVLDGADCTADFGGQVQLQDEEGRLFTVYPVDPDHAYEYREGPFVPAGPDVDVPDMRTAIACSVECRWEDLFVATVGRLAARLRRPMWVLDNRNVVWDASTVDPTRVAL